MTDTATPMNKGDRLDVRVERMAHGGEGIGHGPDGRVVFIRGAYPGDEVSATVTEVKKRFAKADLLEVARRGEFHGDQTCPAAAEGAGCCDFGDVVPERELDLKTDIFFGQLGRAVPAEALPELEHFDLAPHRGWRNRVRLGVDANGHAGTRKHASNDLVTDVACTQVADGLLDGIVGSGARTFTSGAEVIVVTDADGQRHVVETRKAPRGSRVERVNTVIEGSGTVTERADGTDFTFPATAFWQAHAAAPDKYTGLIRSWLKDLTIDETKPRVGWDLYGGVGLFVPAIADGLGEGAQVISVDYSAAATKNIQEGLQGYDVQTVNNRVDKAVSGLPGPQVVVLDPPRTGAGAQVISQVAQKNPGRVIHVGCDPATFSRDIALWAEHKYVIQRLAIINAFPGTHHFEVVAQLGK